MTLSQLLADKRHLQDIVYDGESEWYFREADGFNPVVSPIIESDRIHINLVAVMD